MARERRPSRPPRRESVRALRESNGMAVGAGHAHIAKIQRARILSATFDTLAELGAANTSVADIVTRSGVSRRTFYELFADREDCCTAAFEHALDLAAQSVLPGYEAQGRWSERIRCGLDALLRFLDEQPPIARVLIVESLAAGPGVLRRRAEAIERLIAAVDAGRVESKLAPRLLPLTAEGTVGGVLSILQTSLAREPREPLVKLLNPLMGMIVMPYLGAAAARRELERPAQPPQRATPPSASPLVDPFKPAGMRLTYRTVRVLMTVAEHPGASNRTIGDAAEIRDQGQISKLLNRLKRYGLIDNTGVAPGQGAPNAWALTPAGEQMASSLRTHTEELQ
ncbi:MAG: TetR/AcrR family transcriptional regulator [Solirubrobacteraceae bacterium]